MDNVAKSVMDFQSILFILHTIAFLCCYQSGATDLASLTAFPCDGRFRGKRAIRERVCACQRATDLPRSARILGRAIGSSLRPLDNLEVSLGSQS